jgi:pimeloyl-ACP methyl ester carboxylesterase
MQGEGRVATISRDGVTLAYDKVDGASRPLVFIHGWCCDRTYFAPQVAHFAGLGHAVLALDLRGHGESDAPEGPYTMQVLADDVAWLCRELGVTGPVVVGHSMGGIAAFDLAVRHPELVAGVVMIDSAVTRPEASRAGLPAFIGRLKGPDRVPVVQDYVRRVLFQPTDDAARCDAILAAMAKAPAHVMAGALQGMYDWDPNEAAGMPLPPMLFIANSGKPLSDLARLEALVPGLMQGQVVGSGHFCTLEVPDQVNAMVGRFVNLNAENDRPGNP